MKRWILTSTCATVVLLAACATPGQISPVARTFANPAALAIPAAGDTIGPADPYPSAIAVTDMPGSMVKLTVTLSALAHDFPRDLDVLLVGPTGLHALLLSDAGGHLPAAGVTLVFDAAHGAAIPEDGPLVSGTFRPTALGAADAFDAPAPTGPYAPDLTVFNGTNPNGSWLLYVYDDFGGDVGTLAGGWSLTITAN